MNSLVVYALLRNIQRSLVVCESAGKSDTFADAHRVAIIASWNPRLREQR